MEMIDANNLLLQGQVALAEVERAGIRVDESRLDESITDIQRRIAGIEERLKASPEWETWRRLHGKKANFGSRVQLGKVMTKLGYESNRTTASGKPAMDEEFLATIPSKFVRRYLRLEKLKKAKSTYLDGLKREVINGRVHPIFNLNTVETFRSSCSLPNIQNVIVRDEKMMRIVRSCFVPSEGNVLVEADYGQLEFKISACLVGETKIETIDGPQSIRNICERLQMDKDVYVFGHDLRKGRLAIGKVLGGGKTRYKVPVWKVTIDNGKEIVATPDHKFLLRDGTYIQLRDLRSGMSLMPFYQRKKVSRWKTVYKELYLNNGEKMLVHNLIALDLFGVDIGNSNMVVHHRDHNGCNNSLSNIEIMGRRRHMSIHAKQGWKKQGRKEILALRNKSLEARERSKRVMAQRKLQWTDQDWEEWRTRISESSLRQGSHEGIKNGMYGRKHSEETKRKMRKRKEGYLPIVSGWNKGLTKETNESVRRISEAAKGRVPYNKNVRRMKTVSCMWCGQDFLVRSWHRRKFCNKSCSIRYRNDRYGNPMLGKEAWNKGKKWHRNHKVVSVEPYGIADVWNISVEGFHNFATHAGVIVKNCFWKDPTLIEYASDERKDVHRDSAAEIFDLPRKEVSKKTRYVAKNQFVFPQLYGSYYVECAKNIWESIFKHGLRTESGEDMVDALRRQGIDRLGACDPRATPLPGTFEHRVKEAEDRFYGRFATLKRRMDDWWSAYQQTGEFRLLTGFRISGSHTRNFLMNAPIQGAAFHCLLWSLICLQREMRRRRMKSRIITEIHDSLLLDAPREELPELLPLIRRVMTEDIRKAWDWIIVPLKVEIQVAEKDWSRKVEWTDKEGIWGPKAN